MTEEFPIGAVAGLLGIGGGGSDWKAQQANVINPLEALAPSNAAAQQATGLVAGTAQGLAPAALLGLQRQNEQYGAMQGLAQQLGAQSRGEGPNPALAQLAETTGQNVSNTAALMAGARGASANPGMVARLAAQQGAATEQQAIQQAAVLRAQQQLAAQQQLQAQQQAQAGLGTVQVGQGLGAAQAGAGAAGNFASMLAAQLGDYNKQNIANTQQANAANAHVQSASESPQSVAGGLGTIGGGIGRAVGLFAGGGEVPKKGPVSDVGKFLQGVTSAPAATEADRLTSPSKMRDLAGASEEIARGRSMAMEGTTVNAVPVGSSYKKDPYGGYAKGGKVKDMRAGGGKIAGRAKTEGDSYSNDTVDAKLSPGEIVLPRSVTQSADPAGNAARFVAAVMAQKRRR